MPRPTRAIARLSAGGVAVALGAGLLAGTVADAETAGPAAVSWSQSWSQPVVNGANISMSSPVVVDNGGSPFIVTGDLKGNLRAFSLRTGSRLSSWSSVNAGFEIKAPLSSDGTNLYVPVAQDGKDRYPSLKKYGPTGSLLWNSNTGTSYGSAGRFLLSGMSLARISGQWKAFVGSSGHWVYRADAGTGKQEWAFRNADSTMATPALADLYGAGSPQVITSNDKSPETSTDKAGGHLRIFTAGGRQVCSADQLANGSTYQSSGYNNSSPAVAEVAGEPLIVFGSTGPVQTGAGGNQIVAYDGGCNRRWASVALAGQAAPSPSFANVTGDATPEVIEVVGVPDGTGYYPRAYVLDARTGATLGDTGTALRGYGGNIRYTQASSIVTADADGDGGQDLFVPASGSLLVLDGATRQVLASLPMGGAIQNTPVITAEPGGGIRVTLAGYSANNGSGSSGGIIRSFTLPDGAMGSVGWPRFGHDSQLTGLQGTLAGPYDQLLEGQTLPSGASLRTRTGYTATMQPDGNLVLRRSNGTSYWSTGTSVAGSRLYLAADGTLRVVSPTGDVVWSSNAGGPGVERLVLHTDGQLRAYSGNLVGTERTTASTLIWSTDSRLSLTRDRISKGEVLARGQSLAAFGGRYKLVLHSDGNLKLYNGTTVRWQTATKDTTATAQLVVLADGNVALRSSSKLLKSWGLSGRGGLSLVVGSDGVLRVVTPAGATLWSVSAA